MSYGIKLKTSGPYACFTRPEMKVERLSYDVMTPSAARGILEAIHWKPAIRWVIDAIHILKPIRFHSIRRNEVGGKASSHKIKTAMNTGSLEDVHILVDHDRQQRAATILIDVAYVIEAHFEMTKRLDRTTMKASIWMSSTAGSGAVSAFTSPASAPASSTPVSN